MLKKNILILGNTGLIGSYLFMRLKENFNVKICKRDFLSNFLTNQKISKQNKIHAIINCIYDYSDQRLNKNNNNYQIASKILDFKIRNKIKLLINISTLTTHDLSKSKYGMVKKCIEELFEKKIGCYSIRLGLPSLCNKNIGLLKKIIFLQRIILIFNIHLRHNQKIYQRITNLEDFSLFLECFFNDYKNYPKIFSFSSQILLNFNCLLRSFSPGINIYLPIKLISYILRLFEFFKIPFLFKYDNLIGLTNCPRKLLIKNYD